jgi:hypothetical protein
MFPQEIGRRNEANAEEPRNYFCGMLIDFPKSKVIVHIRKGYKKRISTKYPFDLRNMESVHAACQEDILRRQCIMGNCILGDKWIINAVPEDEEANYPDRPFQKMIQDGRTHGTGHLRLLGPKRNSLPQPKNGEKEKTEKKGNKDARKVEPWFIKSCQIGHE